ncbi:hypothetical protein BDF14DRAFT_1759171 [Spinellus fusiger]|nr:hypothetical protein BDF14DRAFT_1759171 [Spinellus fusiger]
MSKRSAVTDDAVWEGAKRTRLLEHHATDCNDTDCKGCDVGDIEITFVDEQDNGQQQDPTAQELLAMALEEAARPTPQTEVVRRLFDMAVDKYTTASPEDRVGYAVCLVELGQSLQVEESLREGLDILRGQIKSTEQVSVHLALAHAAIALAAFLRQQKNRLFEDMREELVGSDGEEDEVSLEELVRKQQVTREEVQLYKEAVKAMDKAVTEQDHKETDVKAVYRVLHPLLSYTQLLDSPAHADHVHALTEAITRYIQCLSYEKDSSLLNVWAACLLHQLKFEQGQAKVHAMG